MMIFNNYVQRCHHDLISNRNTYCVILTALLRFAHCRARKQFQIIFENFGQLKLKSQRTRDSRTPLLPFIQQRFIDLIGGSVISKGRI